MREPDDGARAEAERVGPAYRVVLRIGIEARPPRQPEGILGEQDPVTTAGGSIASDQGGAAEGIGYGPFICSRARGIAISSAEFPHVATGTGHEPLVP